MYKFGHLYVLGMENGKVKVGVAMDVGKRILAHRMTIGKVSPITREWVSVAHKDYYANEGKLIAFMGNVGEIATADYDAVVEYAKTLPLDTSLDGIPESLRLRKERLARVQKAKEESAAKALDVVRRRNGGETLREIACSLGVSHQRVAQIIKKHTEEAA